METVDTRTFEEKMEYANEKVKDLARKGIDYATEHPIETATGLFALGSGIFGLSKEAAKLKRAQDESRRIWDPELGIYLYTKHQMTGYEKLEFSKRVKRGESRAQVLESMGLLNKRR